MNNIMGKNLRQSHHKGLSACAKYYIVLFIHRLLFAIPLMCLVLACRHEIGRQSQVDGVDSLAPYRIALNFLQNKRFIPRGDFHKPGFSSVYVYDELTCFPINVLDINNYDEIMQIAKSDRYAPYRRVRTVHPCQDHQWPRIQQLSNTTSKRVVIRFDEADSASFAPLTMVSCLIYDNKYNREDLSWDDFTDVDYYHFAVFIDPMDSVVYYIGGQSQR